jgi:hypothetical protein
MRKLIIIRPGKHVGTGRTAGGRDKRQVAEFAVRNFSLVCTFTQASFVLGKHCTKVESSQKKSVFSSAFNLSI